MFSSSESILISFLSTILKINIKEIKMQKDSSLIKSSITEKNGILDILALLGC